MTTRSSLNGQCRRLPTRRSRRVGLQRFFTSSMLLFARGVTRKITMLPFITSFLTFSTSINSLRGIALRYVFTYGFCRFLFWLRSRRSGFLCGHDGFLRGRLLLRYGCFLFRFFSDRCCFFFLALLWVLPAEGQRLVFQVPIAFWICGIG